MDMTQVLSQMGILVFIMVVGFVCAKLGVTGPEFNRRLSGVVMNVLLVFTVLYSVMNTDIEMDLAELGLATLSFFVMFIVMSVIGYRKSEKKALDKLFNLINLGCALLAILIAIVSFIVLMANV